MRPLELVLNGFRSYAEETRFDWRDRRLVGVVGPIGSGKSSILDAIAFALYGSTPAFERDTKALINQRGKQAQVSLTFRVGGQTWRVVRVVRQIGQGSHALYPVDEATGEADQGAAITGQRAVTDRVIALLGLDFDAFRRSVLLAQNRFAEFLNATATERDRVLQGVFNLDRVATMQERARDRLRDAERDARDLEARLAEVAAARERVRERTAERAGLAARAAALEAARPAIESHARNEREARAEAAAAQQRLADLDALRQGLPQAEESNRTIDGFAALDETAARTREARHAAEIAAEQARATRDAALAEAGGTARLDEAASALQARGHAVAMREDRAGQQQTARGALDEAERGDAEAQARASEAVAQAQRAEASLAVAERTVAAADAALHAAERLDYALTLRGEIAAGDACPVCGRKIAKLPPGEASPDLDRAQTDREAAQDAAQQAAAAATRAREAAAAAAATAAAKAQQRAAAAQALAGAEAALAEADRALAAAEARVRALLGDGGGAQRLADLRAAITTADGAAQDADRALQQARAAEQRAQEAREAGGHALTSLRVRLASVATTLGVEQPDGDAPATVRALLEDVRARWLAERGAATDRERAALDAAESAARRLVDALGAAGVPPEQPFDTAVAETAQRVAVLEALIGEDERRIAAAAEAEREAAAIEERRGVYQRLSTDLTPAHFLNYLLEDERTSLAEIGSEWFERLSRGRYRFADDGSFDVIDLTAAERARRSETLSGGETFLASLSLALALAEMVTQGGGRLDAFFLDEGFGSLDEEHLDLAMEGIERLVTESDDRLVVIVSHVPALRERIEDLIVLDRDPATGHTIVRRGLAASTTARATVGA